MIETDAEHIAEVIAGIRGAVEYARKPENKGRRQAAAWNYLAGYLYRLPISFDLGEEK